MIITVKILQGRECTVEVSTTSSVSVVKQLVARELDIPVDQQRLVFRGKTLSDSQCLSDYNIVDGTKLHLVVRKGENGDEASIGKDNLPLWEEMHKFLQLHFTETDAAKVLEQFKKDFSQNLQSWSLDDIERIAHASLETTQNGCSSKS